MATENHAASPSAIPQRASSTPDREGSDIQREMSSTAHSELESAASGSTLGTRTPFSRPSTETPIVGTPSPTILSPNGSHIDPRSDPSMEAQKFDEPKGQRLATVYALSSAGPYPPAASALASTSSTASTLAETLVQPIPTSTSRHSLLSSESRPSIPGSRSSLSTSISGSPPLLPLTSTVRATSTQEPSSLILKDGKEPNSVILDLRPSHQPHEGTALLAPKTQNSAAESPSAFELPAYLKCDLISQIFSWALNNLYDVVKEFVDSLRWENFTRPFGEDDNSLIRFMVLTMWVNNLVGMVAQGLLGGLNAEDFASTHISNAITLSISVLIVFTIAAMEGKRRLVGMFNQMAVERIPARIDNFPQNVAKADVLLSAVTWPVKVVISGVFSVLAQVSLSKEYGAARVLLKYHQPWANSAADFLTSMPVTAISMFSAFTINLIGFPTKFALLTVLGSLDRAIQTPAYKQRQAQVQHYIDALLLHVISLYENNRHNEIRVLLDQVRARPESNIIDQTIGYVVANGISLPQRDTWASYIIRQAKALAFFGVSVYGISNFYSVAEQFLVPYLSLPASLGPPIGVLAMTGMTALSFMAVYVPFSTNEPELRILTTGEKIRNWTATITMCGLGALTNLQQAIMTNSLTNPVAIGISYGSAFLSPVFIEVNGYYTYTTTPIVKKRIANNANLKTAHETVEFFRSTRNSVTNLNEDTLNSHYEMTDSTATRETRPPKYLPTLFFKSVKRPSPSAAAIEGEFVLIEHGQVDRSINL